jgi:hypothetical protein
MRTLTYVKDPRVARVLELAEKLRKSLEYPNCENSRDERYYTEHFEAEILKVINNPIG